MPTLNLQEVDRATRRDDGHSIDTREPSPMKGVLGSVDDWSPPESKPLNTTLADMLRAKGTELKISP